MGGESKSKPPLDILENYTKLIKTIPELEVKGATTAYTSYNGNMFTFLSNSGEFGIRLPTDLRVQFMDKIESNLFKQYGKFMNGYVEVPLRILGETELLKPYLSASFEYVKTLNQK